MIVTIDGPIRLSKEWLNFNFSRFNDAFFGSKLENHSFIEFPLLEKDSNGEYQSIYGTYKRVSDHSRPRSFFGNKYYDKPGFIILDESERLPEKEWQEHLLHQMIHQYIYSVLQIEPKDPHGLEFQQIAVAIQNKGWNVMRSNWKPKR